MNSIIKGFGRAFSTKLYVPLTSTLNNSFRRNLFTIRPADTGDLSTNFDQKNRFLLPSETSRHTQVFVRNLKYVVNVHRRCKDCFLMYIEGVLHNFCTAHPRHKQRMRTKRPKNTWILSGVTTQTKLRPRR